MFCSAYATEYRGADRAVGLYYFYTTRSFNVHNLLNINRYGSGPTYSEGKGRTFESCRARQNLKGADFIKKSAPFFILPDGIKLTANHPRSNSVWPLVGLTIMVSGTTPEDERDFGVEGVG